MTDTSQSEAGAFWDQQHGESSEAYHAFTIYRDLGLTRSVRKAAAIYYHDTLDALSEVTQGQRANLLKWSRRWLWVSRAETSDAEEDRERMLKLRERRLKMSEQHFAIGSLALQRAAQRLQTMGLTEEIPLKSLAPLIRAGADLQRLALGEPTAIEDVRGTTRSPEEENLVDISALSREDQEELARIAGLLEDSDDLPE